MPRPTVRRSTAAAVAAAFALGGLGACGSDDDTAPDPGAETTVPVDENDTSRSDTGEGEQGSSSGDRTTGEAGEAGEDDAPDDDRGNTGAPDDDGETSDVAPDPGQAPSGETRGGDPASDPLSDN